MGKLGAGGERQNKHKHQREREGGEWSSFALVSSSCSLVLLLLLLQNEKSNRKLMLLRDEIVSDKSALLLWSLPFLLLDRDQYVGAQDEKSKKNATELPVLPGHE